MIELRKLHQAVLDGDARTEKSVTEEALAAGVEPFRLLHEFLKPAMDEVARRFEANECFSPEFLVSARAMKAALELIRPLLIASGAQPAGRVVLGTVKGDMSDLGKRLVGAMLEAGGFEVVDLGVNVSPEQFIAAVKEKNANIVAMSTLFTYSIPWMKTIVDALKETGIRDKVRVLISGLPVTQKYADEIGADGYAESAAGAVATAHHALGVKA